MPGVVNANELPPDVAARLGVPVRERRARQAKRTGAGKASGRMDVEQVRRYAIRVLAVVADLTKRERARVLRDAAKLNELR